MMEYSNTIRFCDNCGNEVHQNEAFCGNCGAPIHARMIPNQVQVETTQPPQTKQKKKTKLFAIIAIVASAGLLLIGTIVLVAFLLLAVLAFSPKDFNDQYSDLADKSWCEIAEDGSWIQIDTNPYNIDDYSNALAWGAIESINADLGFSSAISEEMKTTRALDGKQSATAGKYTVTWSYHPDRGLLAIYKIND